jgi:hypothetical protein
MHAFSGLKALVNGSRVRFASAFVAAKVWLPPDSDR